MTPSPARKSIPVSAEERAEVILDAIYEQHAIIYGEDGECWHCGGEGYVSDCFEEWACIDPESGCEECTSRCRECAMAEANRERAVRIDVLRALDVDLGIAWVKRKGRWKPETMQWQSQSQNWMLAQLHAGRVACDAFTDDERADSACWVEGLI